MGKNLLFANLLTVPFRIRLKRTSEDYSFWCTLKINLRRFYYITFKKKYVEEMLKKRKGTCGHCGCCRFMFFKCPYQKDKDCLKFNDLPSLCKAYPFDEKDKYPFSKKHCEFYWEK